jgi:hypothetical protein
MCDNSIISSFEAMDNMMKTVLLGIFICLLTLSQTCLAQVCLAVQYSITVKDSKTVEPIFNAEVTIDLSELGLAPKILHTDKNGYAATSIEEIPPDQPVRHVKVTVKANGYQRYVETIDLNGPTIHHDVQLKPNPPQNRLGLAAGYTRFKEMDVTYALAGFAYMYRIIPYGYLGLTVMLSIGVEDRRFESEATNTEIEFGSATSVSINYAQAVPLGKGFSLLIEPGFQWLNINDSQGDKLIRKTNLLIGGGLEYDFEYNYKVFFLQANLSAVIGKDKNLGHDLDATIKIGINF